MSKATSECPMRVEHRIPIFDELARTVTRANTEHRDARAVDDETSAPFFDGEEERFGAVRRWRALAPNATIGMRLWAEGEDFLDGIVEIDGPGFTEVGELGPRRVGKLDDERSDGI